MKANKVIKREVHGRDTRFLWESYTPSEDLLNMLHVCARAWGTCQVINGFGQVYSLLSVGGEGVSVSSDHGKTQQGITWKKLWNGNWSFDVAIAPEALVNNG